MEPKAEKLGENCLLVESPQEGGDAPEWALIMAPINCRLLLELGCAPRERDFSHETAEMGYPLTQPAPAPKLGCCRVCGALPRCASCQEMVLPVLLELPARRCRDLVWIQAGA